MKKLMIPVVGVLLVAGCAAPQPELLGLMERDNAMYVDGGATEQKAEQKEKVAIYVSQGDYKDYKSVAEAIDAQLTESLSAFAFFDVVERSNIGALQQEKFFTGEDIYEDLIEASDYMVTAKMNSLKVDTYVPTAAEQLTSLSGSSAQVRTRVSLSVDFRFYELATKRTILTKNITKEYSGLEDAQAMSKLALAAQECVKGFAHTIGSKFAPPARVVQTRGNCQVARISMGTNYGLVKGVEVEFYEFIDNSAIIAGATRDKNVIAKGRVLETSSNTAWVEVYDYEKVWVKRGDYVSICEDQSNRMRMSDYLRYQ